MEYQLELKQIVDFPRCRIYRNFIQTLLNDRSIRTTGGSFLFWYLILCSYANYSNSNRRMEAAHLYALTWRMDLQHLRTAGLVSLPVPASGHFHPEASPGGKLHYLFPAGEKPPGQIPDH